MMLRPHRLLILLLAWLCLENSARVALSIQQATQLPNLPTLLSPVYLAISSAIWAVMFAVCMICVARAWRWTPHGVLAVSVAYQVYLWINRLAFSANSEALAVAGFRFMLSLLILGITALLLWLSRKRYGGSYRGA